MAAWKKKSDDLVEQVLMMLYRADDPVRAIEQVLAVLGQSCDVSRVYILEDSDDGRWTRNTFEWCAPGIRSEKAALAHYDYRFEGGVNTYYRQFDDTGIFYCPDVRVLESDVRQMMESQSVHAVLQCTLVDNGRICGFLGYDECRENRRWTVEQTATLALVARLVATFLLKAREREDAIFSRDFRAALDNSASFMMIMDPDNWKILHLNRSLREKLVCADSSICYQALFGADAPCPNCPAAALRRTGLAGTAELRCPDGSWVLSQASPLHWQGRDMVMLSCVDITGQKQAEETLRRRNAESGIVLRQSGKYIQRYGLVSRVRTCPEDVCALLGVKSPMEDYPESLLRGGVVFSGSAETVRRAYADMRGGKPSGSYDVQLRLPDGAARWFRCDYTLVSGENGTPAYSLISFYDNTAAYEKELAYEKLHESLKAVVSASITYREVNLSRDTVERSEGDSEPSPGAVSYSTLIRQDAERAVEAEDRAAYLAFFDRLRLAALFATGTGTDVLEYRTAGGRWQTASIYMAKHPRSDDIEAFLVFTDSDREHRERERLERLANLDAMTQLLNRSTAEGRIRRALEQAEPEDVAAIFMVDLDNFKTVNDTMGHQAGDEVLRRVAAAISESFRPSDVVGRLGGDEFVAFIARGASERLAASKAGALVEGLQFAFGEVVVSASVGISLCRGGSKTFEQMYAEVDAALYQAKSEGKGRYCMSGGAVRPEPESVTAAVQLKLLLDNMGGGVILADVGEEIRVTYISPSFYKTMGRTLEETGRSGEKLLSLVEPEDAGSVLAALREAAGASVAQCVYRTVGEKRRWRQLRAVRLSAGGPDGATVIGVISDISELKHSEERLRLAEEKYRLATQLTGAMIWEVDLAGRTLVQTEETARRLGQTATVWPNVPESLLASGTIHPDSEEDFRRMYADLYAGNDRNDYTLLCRNDEGKYAWVRASFRLLRNGAGQAVRSIGVVEFLPNIEEEMRTFRSEIHFMELVAPSAMAVLRANLTRDTVEKSTLSRALPVSGRYTDLFAAGDDAAPEDAARLAAFADREAMIASYREGQTWRLLEYRRPDGTWVNLAVNLLRRPVDGDIYAFGYYRDINIRRRWEALVSAKLEQDSFTLLYTRSSLRALADAVLGRSGPDQRGALTIFDLGGAGRLRSAQGVTSAQKFRLLFSRVCRIVIGGDAAVGQLDEFRIAFFRVGAHSDEQLRSLAESDRERVRMLLSQAMPGTEVEIGCGFAAMESPRASFAELERRAEVACATSEQWPGRPVISYADPQTAGNAGTELSAPAGQARPRVLTADDDPVTRELLRTILSGEFQVDQAPDGAQALELLRSGRYDLLISDIHMPVKSGWDVLEEVRRDRRLAEVPVMVITADAESEVRALSLGAADVVTKPFAAKTLRTRAANIIGRRAAARIEEENRLYELQFQQQANLLRLAERDELTGLYNRQAFYRLVRQRLDAEPNARFLLVRGDLDDFHVLNDVLGNAAGDRFLQAMAAEIRRQSPPDSLCARMHADHFMVFLRAEEFQAEAACARMGEWLGRYSLELKLSGRMGVYAVEDRTLDVASMCDRALLALKSVKGSFAHRLAYYQDSMRSGLLAEQELTAEMLPGLRSGQFCVYFQPQYNYDSGELVGAEALVRWNHPRRGILTPDQFLSLFERSGAISALDEFVWEESCRCMRRWLQEENVLVPVSVSVNLSRIDIYNPRLCENLLALVERYALPPACLRLEITESAYMQNPAQLLSTVQKLHGAGFSVEMDDFGSGYSALAALKDVPVDGLKVDMRFLSDAADDPRTGKILSSVIRMAHWLELPVLAEGVETRPQADYLKNLNCCLMQGYLFGGPMPEDTFRALLRGSTMGIAGSGAIVPGNVESFWEASSPAAQLFNTCVGGACILEAGENAAVLLANDQFFRELGLSRQESEGLLGRLQDGVEAETRPRFRQALERAARSGTGETCTVRWSGGKGGALWLRCRMRLLSGSDRRTVYLAVENVTAQRRTLEEARSRTRELQAEKRCTGLLLRRLHLAAFRYDCARDTLLWETGGDDSEPCRHRVEHFLAQAESNPAIPPASAAALRRDAEQAMQTPGRAVGEYTLDLFGSGLCPCRAEYAAVADESGRVCDIVGLVCPLKEEQAPGAESPEKGE